MVERKFKIGDKVMAKWPKSTLYFEGEVEDFNDIEYLVKFDDPDESKLAIKYKDVQSSVAFRPRSQSRGRSPARAKKSPGRKSPARKSPARPKAASKSPARKPKAEPKTKADTSRSSSKGSKSSSKSPSRASTKRVLNSSSTVTTTSTLVTSVNNKEPSSVTSVRQSARIAASSIEKNNDVKHTSVSSSSASKSSNTSCCFMVRTKIAAAVTTSWSIVWPILKTLPLIVLAVVLPVVMTVACTKKSCTVTAWPTLSTDPKDYYDQWAVLTAVGGLLLQFLLTFLPVKTKTLPNGAKARNNGMVTLLLLGILIVTLHYFKYPITNVCLWTKQYAAVYAVIGIVLAAALYIKSYYVRAPVNSRTIGHFLPDFIEGREVAPRFLSVDVKSFLFRTALINTIIYTALLMFREYQSSKGSVSPALGLVCGMQLVYLTSLLYFEDNMYTTWEYLKRGTGLFVTAGYLSCPIYFSVFTKFVFSFKPTMPWYCHVGIGLLFLLGYIICTLSNNQKNAFRVDPSNPKLAQLESIRTAAGTRLLVSGWWGFLRHPNYLGDIIMLISFGLVCGFSHAFPWVIVGINVAYMFGKVFEVEGDCSKKYGHSWTTYTNKVKSRLIPGIF